MMERGKEPIIGKSKKAQRKNQPVDGDLRCLLCRMNMNVMNVDTRFSTFRYLNGFADLGR